MTKKRNVARLVDAVSLSQIVGAVVDLSKNGTEWKGLCPFHQEKNPSFTIFNGSDGKERYACHGCSARGDSLQFVMDYYQLEFKPALDMLEDLAGGAGMESGAPLQRESLAKVKRQTWEATPIDIKKAKPPKSIPVHRDGDWYDMPVVGAWPYCGVDGLLWGYACRIEKDGKKDVIPMTWKVNPETGEARFKQGALPEPRLLYGTEALAANPKANIILVEGEKAADAARRLLDGRPGLVLTWPGGCKAVGKADWSLLAGRKVVGWPDCDSQRWAENQPQAGLLKPYHEQPGMAAMLHIAEELRKHGAAMRIVAVPAPGGAWPNGYDLADLEEDGWTGDEVMAYLKANLKAPDEIAAHGAQLVHQEQQMPAVDMPDGGDQMDDAYADMEPDDRDYHVNLGALPEAQKPFRFLGCNRTSFFYLPKSVSQIIELSAAAHFERNLLVLADIDYWQDRFSNGKKGVDWAAAANFMIRMSQRAGVYRPENVRGTGAWYDDGRVVVHVGDRLLIDGVPTALTDIDSAFIYEQRQAWSVNINDPLTAYRAKSLYNLCQKPSWLNPIYGALYAGFCLLAPICGALRYRPSIWITGPSGSGKTTVAEEIGHRCIVGCGLKVASSTSEAGIRQIMDCDAMPIAFDELEMDSKKAPEQVQGILKLLTLSATDNGSAIVKGSANGGASSYRIRSMFMFSSINANVVQHAAKTRISMLNLKPVPQTQQSVKEFSDFLEEIAGTLTPQYIAQLQARAIRLIPVIRHNALVFAEAGAVVLGMRRLADQIGTLLAGAYALHSDSKISEEKAKAWLESKDWSDVTQISEMGDDVLCLQRIQGHIVRVATATSGQIDQTIGQLLTTAVQGKGTAVISFAEMKDVLARYGIKVEQDGVWVANVMPQIEKIMADTPWQKSWGPVLGRLPGARKGANPSKFAGVLSRYTVIPKEVFL